MFNVLFWLFVIDLCFSVSLCACVNINVCLCEFWEANAMADDWNWTVDSCECVLVDSVAVQCVVYVVAPQEFYSFLPETTDQWKCCLVIGYKH